MFLASIIFKYVSFFNEQQLFPFIHSSKSYHTLLLISSRDKTKAELEYDFNKIKNNKTDILIKINMYKYN